MKNAKKIKVRSLFKVKTPVRNVLKEGEEVSTNIYVYDKIVQLIV